MDTIEFAYYINASEGHLSESAMGWLKDKAYALGYLGVSLKIGTPFSIRNGRFAYAVTDAYMLSEEG